MVLVPIHRVTRRMLGLLAFIIGLAAILLFLGQVHHIYHQHLKFRRLEGYNRYVDDVTNDFIKLENLANKSSLSVDQFIFMFAPQQAMQTKQDAGISNSSNNGIGQEQTVG